MTAAEAPPEEVLDPSLPLMRNSERACFKKCVQQWWWAYIEELIPKKFTVGAREFGSGIHLCLAEWYGPEGRNPLETWDEWAKGIKRDQVKAHLYNEEEWKEMYEKGAVILEEYLAKYGDDDDWIVIAVELPFAANIGGVVYDVGTIDLVIRSVSTGEIWAVDHKTAKQFPNWMWLYMDTQSGSYTAVATHILREKGLIKDNEKVAGFIFNYMKKAKRDERPKDEEGRALNKDGSVSKRQPVERFHRETIERIPGEVRRQMEHILNDAKVMTEFREGRLPVTKNPSQECTWCDFFELCKADEAGQDTDRLKQMLYKKSDPYADHRNNAARSKVSVMAYRTAGVRG